MKKIGNLWVLYLCICGSAYAQQPMNIDSLRKVMLRLEQKTPSYTNDTNKIKTLREIMVYHSMSSDSGLYYSQRVMTLAERIKWPKGIALAHLCFAMEHSKNKPNEWRLSLQKAMAIAKTIKNDSLLGECYWGLAAMYGGKRSHVISIKYFELAAMTYLKAKSYFEAANAYNNIGATWNELGNKKKAMAYYQKELLLARQHKQELAEAFALNNIGDILEDSTGYKEEALLLFEEANQLFEKLNRPIYLAQGEFYIGKEYLKQKHYSKALPYLQHAWGIYQKYHWGEGLDMGIDFEKSLYEVHKGLNQPAKALFYLEKYTALLDSALKSEIQAQRDIVKIQEEKEKQQTQISNLQNKEIQQERTLQKRTQNFLWVGLGMLLLIGAGLLWYNRKLRLKNKDLEDKNEIIREVTHKIQETEITALRAQMNPHFIFNCLNSIQLYTAQNNTEKATDYLNKFSRLIRLVLENSRSDKVSVGNELETLRLYMEMEAMRFRGKVNFQINIAQNVDRDSIQIPPLLIQPFVENAIWHGLMHKEEGGMIRIEVTQPNDDLLRFDITDDGVGREKAAEFKSKSATQNKSFGMKVTAERIELINQLYNTATQVQIIDLRNKQGEATGTKVVVEIPI
ncbi:MAG: histidine kinase [Spirosomataceae bacterium]